jgi:hypothetical protein
MKKLVLILVLVFLPMLAAGKENQTLLAPDGTLYIIEQVDNHENPDVDNKAKQSLVLTTRRGTDAPVQQTIPATMSKGAHGSATMAYDAESKMLFVLWLHETGTTNSELLFASLDAQGTWSGPTSFGARYNERRNLTIAVTRKVFDLYVLRLVPAVTVHASWWEWDSRYGGWSARYAMLPIEDGKVVEPSFHELAEFLEVDRGGTPADGPASDVFQRPMLFPSATQDGVHVIFGELLTNQLYYGVIRPWRLPHTTGRLRVPVGRREGGFSGPQLNVASGSAMGAIYVDAARLAVYVGEEKSVRYVVMRNGVWSEERAIALDAQITERAAIDAIRILVQD